MDRLSESDAERLRSILLSEREQVLKSDIDWCIARAESTGALDAAAIYCEKQAYRATMALEDFPEHPAKAMLIELVDYLTIDRKA